MFTSDVTARGMDYPDVSQVIQVGIPSDKAQYVHRIGRTGRELHKKGKDGKGILLLSDQEQMFLKAVSKNQKDLPIKERPGAPETEVDNYNQHVSISSNKTNRYTSSYRSVFELIWIPLQRCSTSEVSWVE